MKLLLSVFFACMAIFATAQDYTMFETHSLTAIPGEEAALEKAIAEHNKAYHGEGPYQNYVFTVLTGPRSGRYLFAMGSLTFSQMDDRPMSEEHNADWQKVMNHCSGGITDTEYWRLVERASYMPEGVSLEGKTLCKVRYFDVSDNSDFGDMQERFRAVEEALGSTIPRIMYRNRMMNNDGRDWALVSWYDSWADLDSGDWDTWKEAYIRLYGEDAWDVLGDNYDRIVISREDEMRAPRRDLQASQE